MTQQKMRKNDPFRSVDDSQQPEKIEYILLDKLEGYYHPIVEWFFERCLDCVQPNAVLEVGSGTGHLLNTIANRIGLQNKRFHGIDRSAFLLERATKRFPALSFAQADGRSLPFDDAQFDLAYIATVLAHAEEPQTIVREMKRVVRSGGIVALLEQDFETSTLYPGERDRTRRLLNTATDSFVDGWMGRKLPALLRKTGLDVSVVDAKVRIDTEFDADFLRRIRDSAIQNGLSEEEAKTWYEEICTVASSGDFFFSRTYFCALGRVA